MNPVDFPQANTTYGPPPGYAVSQVEPIRAYERRMQGGPLDGDLMVTVAWRPNDEDLRRMIAGGPVYLTMVGGLAPHFLTTESPT